MRLSKFHLATVKEVPADAEIASHRLMLRAGMIRKLAAGLYTWTPLGLRVLRRVEHVVREEMNRAGAIEVLMPAVQPKELWEETGRWEKFGGQLLKIQDRKDQWYAFGPTHEEVITDFARAELNSYKQLPVNFYQIQTKFRDEIRPRFGVMRAREFIMKDAYSFHLTLDGEGGLEREYRNMYDTYGRIFTRLGLKFRAVQADTGAIGGNASHEFHVLADSGEDAIAFSTESDFAANVELAEAAALPPHREDAAETMEKVSTPKQTTCQQVADLLGLPLSRTVKSVVYAGGGKLFFFLVRGDHELNEVKALKLEPLRDVEDVALATDVQLKEFLGPGAIAGFLGPLNPAKPIVVIADRTVAAMRDFIVGANEPKFHVRGVNWGRDLPQPDVVADIRNAVEGDPSPDGRGTLSIARGIEVGHVFQLGQKYAEAMGATVLDHAGKASTMYMGCYGIGVSRIVAAAIEQNFDDAGIIWPEPMAPWKVAVCVINQKQSDEVRAAAESLYEELLARGVDAVLDDRGLRPGVMFADIELIGIPHRVVVSERGVAAGTYEYRARRASESENLDRDAVIARLT